MISSGKIFPAKFPRLLPVAFACLAFTLAGCESLAKMAKEQQEAAENAYVEAARVSCRRYGFLESTNEFAQCLQNDVIAAKARVQSEVNAEKQRRTIEAEAAKTRRLIEQTAKNKESHSNADSRYSNPESKHPSDKNSTH